jgi:hypothetical protein
VFGSNLPPVPSPVIVALWESLEGIKMARKKSASSGKTGELKRVVLQYKEPPGLRRISRESVAKDLRLMSRGKPTSDDPASVAYAALQYLTGCFSGIVHAPRKRRDDFVDFAEKLFSLEDPRA